MADRVFTSASADETLITIHQATKLDFATIARLAFAYSLRKSGINVPTSDNFEGREIRRISFFGATEYVYRSVLRSVYGDKFEDDDQFFSKRSVVKNHLDNGLNMMAGMLREHSGDCFAVLCDIASELNISESAPSTSDQLDLRVGQEISTGRSIYLHTNDTSKHANFHLAIMGKPGTGKTQSLLKLIADIRKLSHWETNYIFFDYKGDVAANERFVEITRAQCYHLPRERLPVNPFLLDDYRDSSLKISAREKAESFGSINHKIGTVQKGLLQDAILDAYEARKGKQQRFPDMREVTDVLKGLYIENERNDDSLTEVMRDLTEFNLFWEHGSASGPIDQLWRQSVVIDLHELPVLKELVVYLVVERLYKELSSLPDSETINGRRRIRTVLVIDEAHNYLPQRNLFLERIIREGRSKGVAVFLASQSPTDYVQKSFDFKELLEFIMIFQCEGVPARAVQDLLGCSSKTASSLQIEIARLQPFNVITRDLEGQREFTKFVADTFFGAYATSK